MKTIALLTLCVATLSACSPNAQLVTLRSNNVESAPDGLVLDTDTLTLRYNFSSERGQMAISVVNKLDRPLYIDWKRSAFIIGQDKVDYWRDVANVDLSGSAYGGRYSRYAIGSLNSDVRVLPQDQLTSTVVRQYDGEYSYQKLFNKPDGFYIPVPMQ